MILIVGLGNPGKKYAKTRHNLGYMVINKLTKQPNTVIIKPTSFMNDSGVEVKKIANFYKVNSDNIWVVHDDLDQELGKIKIKKGGGSGGHNGVKSIIDNLGVDDFWHFKIGIGRPEQKSQVIDYVLQNFCKEEEFIINKSVDKMVQAITLGLTDGIEKAMNKFNSKL